jgi:CubicO group peptidase (beta-lactamase class C family)
MMFRVSPPLRFVLLLAAALLSGDNLFASGAKTSTVSVTTQESIQREIDQAQKKYDIPAMTVAVWENDKQTLRITRGQRAVDSVVAVTDNDLWHLGSCGKVMTAAMIMRLVDRGVLQLDTPIGAYLPDTLRTILHPMLHKVTLAQLLSHTSGIYDEKDWRNVIKGKAGSRFAQMSDSAEREIWQAVSVTIERKPEHAPGDVFQYSNLGYVLAGFIAAQVTRKSWQQLMHEEVFLPLGMNSAGFGLPGNANALDQPRGHEHGWKWVVIPTTKVMTPTQTNADPAYYGPAGLIHMSMRDWAAFLRTVLAGHQGQPRFLSAQSFARLLTPIKSKNFSEYGFGLRVTKAADGKGFLLDHTGSNGYWRAHFRIDTSRNRIVLMAANLGDDSVDKAFAEVTAAINREFR